MTLASTGTPPRSLPEAPSGVDPRTLQGLLARGDSFAATGDTRSASSFYLAALRAAAGATLPRELVAALDRARERCAAYERAYRDYLRERVGGAGLALHGPRFAQSLDILLGEKRIYLQEPRYYYFPGLPQVQFYERDAFEWFAQVEAATDEIERELVEVMRDPTAFSPYVTGDPNRPRKGEQGMLDNPAWSAFYLWKNGEAVAANVARCPAVMRALRGVPLADVGHRSPSILFSLLEPGAHIPPHNGLVNTRLICHLPLLVPGRARLRVGNDTREWQRGRAWAFDDSIEHEAWNDEAGTRVILLFDVWRPELSLGEREAVRRLFAAIDEYSGHPPEWQI